MNYKEKFQIAFNKCIQDTTTSLDAVECFEKYCENQIVNPVEQEECFAQAKIIDRCHTCKELKLEQLQDRKDIPPYIESKIPVFMNKICAGCVEQFTRYKLPLTDINELLAKIETYNNDVITSADFGIFSDCKTIDTCTKIHLLNKEITELPPEIGELHQLQTLDLNDNQLKELPPEIGQLQQLLDLGLSKNQLQKLSPQIGQLTQLRTLWLGGNQLEKLPPELGNLAQLQTLNLNNNQLKELPHEIGSLQQLITLELKNNKLKSLPPEIGKLTQLQGLWLSNNQLESLPKEIKHLQKLYSIYTKGNTKLSKKHQVDIYGQKNIQQFLQGL